MKTLLGRLLIGLSLSLNVRAVELGSFIPLHFSCIDPSIHTDLGVVDIRLDVFKKGTSFQTQTVLSKDNEFVTGFKQASLLSAQNQIVALIPGGVGYQMEPDGRLVESSDIEISIQQLASAEFQISIGSAKTPNFVKYKTANCH
tara:strand:- start:17791 stop:18222 length:432 start_codon:yes stop_codon:yes gene_type:complete